MLGINQSDLAQMKAAKLDSTCAAIKAAGFESVRFAADWGYLSNLFGSTDYNPLWRVKAALDKHKLIAMPCVGIHYPFNHPVTGFANFTAKVVSIFGAVPYYEVWNEPNLVAFQIGGPASYVKYLKAAAPKIRAKGSKVISAGLAAYPTYVGPLGKNWEPAAWLEAMYAAGENNDYDVLGYHPYSCLADQNATFVDPATNPFGIAQIQALKDVQATHNDTRPMAYTEVGYITPSKVSLANASTWLETQLEDHPATGPTWFFCWEDTAGDGGAYGIRTSAGVPKQPYYDKVMALRAASV